LGAGTGGWAPEYCLVMVGEAAERRGWHFPERDRGVKWAVPIFFARFCRIGAHLER
jgi:hypothetical protein